MLWRDDPAAEATTAADAVLSVGEVAILAAPGGTGKSFLTLALARAASDADAGGQAAYGATCGLRVRAGPVVLVSYEDAPVRIAHRLDRMGGIPADVHVWPDPGSLFVAGGDGARCGEAAPAWAALWKLIRNVSPALVVVDPASAALAEVSVSESGPRARLHARARQRGGGRPVRRAGGGARHEGGPQSDTRGR